MNLGLFSAIGILVLMGIAVWFAHRMLKKKRVKTLIEKTPPQEVLEEFDYFENKMKGGMNNDGTETNPYHVLWEIAQRRRAGQPVRITERTEPKVDDGKLPEQLNRGEGIPSGDTSSINEDTSRPRKSRKESIRDFFSRRKSI